MMQAPKVSVIDYGMGNIWSVISALKYLGVETEFVSSPEKIEESKFLILPGVGSFSKGMRELKSRGIDQAIMAALQNNNAKILGICLGMQLMGSYGTENGRTAGLGLISNGVELFTQDELKVDKIPHVGFNSISFNEGKGLFDGLPKLADFYFTHSYRMLVERLDGQYATCNHGIEFLAAFELGNICGAQFHPEKSQTNGLIFLRNFLQKG
ncbi:imidazole glycerol phosphate synthase subunit HisH [Methylophilaceae bacterium]|nr:imidazole glycerol phosphate synthase subunit HisH [Methylophilaceae bacterium]